MTQRSLVDAAVALANIRFLRYLAVGALNTAFGYALFAVVYLVSASQQAAVIIATAIGALFNFLSTGRIVFGSKRIVALPLFLLSYVLIGLTNLALLHVLAWLGNPLLAQLIALPAIVALSYLLHSRVVFRNLRS